MPLPKLIASSSLGEIYKLIPDAAMPPAEERATSEPPRPLIRALPPADPFPVESLGQVLGNAAKAINDRVQSPMAMCGNSVLATATLAVQPHVDVVLPIGDNRAKPVSGYFITIAETGERKTESDHQAMPPVRQRERQLRDEYDAKREVICE